jgi:Tfp pilus assembly protein PilE
MKTFKNDQSGRSMVEMLGVLAIIGVLSVAGIAGYSKAMAKYKLSKTTDQVSMLVANIRTLYSGQRSYLGLTTEKAISFGVVPNEMVIGKDTISNAYAGEVKIEAADPDSGIPSGAFMVQFNGLGRDTCIALATSDWGSGSSSGLIKMTVGANDYTGAQLPVTLDNAVSNGSCECDSTDCSVAWTYL